MLCSLNARQQRSLSLGRHLSRFIIWVMTSINTLNGAGLERYVRKPGIGSEETGQMILPLGDSDASDFATLLQIHTPSPIHRNDLAGDVRRI